MKLSFKSIYISVFILAAAVLYIGCSSAEQTSGKLAFNAKDYSKAEQEFLKETQQNAQNEEAWFYLAMSRALLGKVNQLEEPMTQYRRIGKNTFGSELQGVTTDVYNDGVKKFQVGESFAKDNKIDDAVKNYNLALEQFRAALILMPNDTATPKTIKAVNNKIINLTIEPILKRGDVLLNSGKYEESITEYTKAESMINDNVTLKEAISSSKSLAYIKWVEDIKKNNPDEALVKSKMTEIEPYLETLKKSANDEYKFLGYKYAVIYYANMNMKTEYDEAVKIRDELEAKLKNNK